MKTYLRYEPHQVVGIISSVEANAVFDFSGNMALSPALGEVGVWNIRQASQIRVLRPEGEPSASHVCVLQCSPDKHTVAAGYSNGEIHMFDYMGSTNTHIHTYRGHRSMCVCISFDSAGTRLVSGGADNDVIVWDNVAHTGLMRLRGHRDTVTGVAFLHTHTHVVVSVSKDTLMKVWDLDTQSCVQTIVGHRAEIYSLALSCDASRIATGCTDNQLRFYSVIDSPEELTDADTQLRTMDYLQYMGSVLRTDSDRCSSVEFHPKGHLFACQSAGKTVEIFSVLTPEAAARKMKRRLKRARHKAKKNEKEEDLNAQKTIETNVETGPNPNPNPNPTAEAVLASDEIEPLHIIKFQYKVRSFTFSSLIDKNGGARALVSLHNNALEVWSTPAMKPDAASTLTHEPTKLSVIEMQGHRSDVRCVCVSSDGASIATVGGRSVKIWAVTDTALMCVRSTDTGTGVCGAFGPQDRHVLIGTKEGKLQIIDVTSGDMVADIEAHDGTLWSVHASKIGVVTGGADHDVKLWTYDVNKGTYNLTLTHTRTIKMSDDVLCVRYTYSHTHVCVCLLDATVRIFFEDSLRFYLNLYGHKLPVTTCDVSDDNTLCVTGSADKTIKIWGLDFGDCHRSLVAHSDTVTCVRFVPHTHYFFSCGKDGSVKQWDADRFEQIQSLSMSASSVWSLDVSYNGAFLVTGGHDRSIRVYVRTDEMVFIEEEREREMELQMEKEIDRDDARADGLEDSDQAVVAGRVSIHSVSGGERLIDALSLAEEEDKLIRAYRSRVLSAKANGEPDPPPRHPNPLLMYLTPERYVLHTLRSIKGQELEQSMCVLPFSYVCVCVRYIVRLLQQGLELELCVRVCVCMLSIHHTQLIHTQALAEELQALRDCVRVRIDQYRDLVGTNLAALTFVKKSLQEKRTAYVIEDQSAAVTKPRRKKKKRSAEDSR